MFDIITFGSATRDMFVISKNFQILKSDDFVSGKGLCVPLGAKIHIDDVVFASGGGATNTAATFALQGLETACVGKIGDDPGGHALIDELKKLGVNTGMFLKDRKQKTAYSVILSIPGGERTIMVYQGACQQLRKEEISWTDLEKTNWFYISVLSGPSGELFEPLINFAYENKIKIAVNPGEAQ